MKQGSLCCDTFIYCLKYENAVDFFYSFIYIYILCLFNDSDNLTWSNHTVDIWS